jgi:hypothetical protein
MWVGINEGVHALAPVALIGFPSVQQPWQTLCNCQSPPTPSPHTHARTHAHTHAHTHKPPTLPRQAVAGLLEQLLAEETPALHWALRRRLRSTEASLPLRQLLLLHLFAAGHRLLTLRRGPDAPQRLQAALGGAGIPCEPAAAAVPGGEGGRAGRKRARSSGHKKSGKRKKEKRSRERRGSRGGDGGSSSDSELASDVGEGWVGGAGSSDSHGALRWRLGATDGGQRRVSTVELIDRATRITAAAYSDWVFGPGGGVIRN